MNKKTREYLLLAMALLTALAAASIPELSLTDRAILTVAVAVFLSGAAQIGASK